VELRWSRSRFAIKRLKASPDKDRLMSPNVLDQVGHWSSDSVSVDPGKLEFTRVYPSSPVV